MQLQQKPIDMITRAILLLMLIAPLSSIPKHVVAQRGDNISLVKLVKLVNKVRKTGYTCGRKRMAPAPPIRWNKQLAKAATLHSIDMHKKKYFSHKGKDGSSAGKRIKRQGYQWSTYTENIANGYHNEEAVMRGWLKSSGHCRNIMNPRVTEMGVGKKGSYWTQVFGRKLR